MNNGVSFAACLARAFGANRLPTPTKETADRMEQLCLCLEEGSRRMNLTAIHGQQDVIVRHLTDCALIADAIPQGARVADVGTGAGFPALPLCILRPDVRVVAIDATGKRMAYVAQTAMTLSLPNLSCKTARAEELGQNALYRGTFDVVLARAVARMNVLCEWCLPLCAAGGFFLAMKGRETEAELKAAAHAIGLLGGSLRENRELVLHDPFRAADDPDASEKRHLIFIDKTGETPDEYPRCNAQIQQKPL